MFERLKQKLREAQFRRTDASASIRPNNEETASSRGIQEGLREALFGDTPLPELLERLSQEAKEQTPWSSFVEAQAAIASGQEQNAILPLRRVLSGSESRVQLIAWTALRKLGVQPEPNLAKQVLGVVVEVPVETALDLVAAYPEHTARYYNYSGAGVIWEAENPRLNSQIDALLAAGQRVANAIGPWEGDRPAPPQNGKARLNILTPSGLHFGEGPMDLFFRDATAGPVLQAAFLLMQALMDIQSEQRPSSSDVPTAS